MYCPPSPGSAAVRRSFVADASCPEAARYTSRKSRASISRSASSCSSRPCLAKRRSRSFVHIGSGNSSTLSRFSSHRRSSSKPMFVYTILVGSVHDYCGPYERQHKSATVRRKVANETRACMDYLRRGSAPHFSRKNHPLADSEIWGG